MDTSIADQDEKANTEEQLDNTGEVESTRIAEDGHDGRQRQEGAKAARRGQEINCGQSCYLSFSNPYSRQSKPSFLWGKNTSDRNGKPEGSISLIYNATRYDLDSALTAAPAASQTMPDKPCSCVKILYPDTRRELLRLTGQRRAL